MLTLDTRMSNLDTRLSTGQTGVHANISSIVELCVNYGDNEVEVVPNTFEVT